MEQVYSYNPEPARGTYEDKIGTEVAHDTRDSDTTFEVTWGGGILWQPPA